MAMRPGTEEEAILRITSEIEPARFRDTVMACLRGDLAPASALVRLLGAANLEAVRVVLDQVTHKAATISRAGDSLVRDRADNLTQLFVETEHGCENSAQLIGKLETHY